MLAFLSFSNAQAGTEEAIWNFDSDIIVNTDNSIDVTETIVYDTGPLERHGIYRDIYQYSSVGYKMKIESVEVADENGQPYIFSTAEEGKNFRIKIGDPDKTFTGQKTYVIKYHATKAVAQFKDFDEIYWNATGNEWPMPIYEANASVLLSSTRMHYEIEKVLQSACYFGPKGSPKHLKTNFGHSTGSNLDWLDCSIPFEDKDGGMEFREISLGVNEGLTIAVGFKKGFVAPYSKVDRISDYFGLLVTGALFLIIFFSIFLYWYKKGRDPKGTGVIVPQYDVPDNLTPLEVAGIMSKRAGAKNISSEIIYLAEQGYLKINEIPKNILGIFKSKDYELLKLKDFSGLPNIFDQKLLNSLFGENSSSVKLSSLKNKFYGEAKVMMNAVSDALLNKGYYRNFGIFPARSEKGVTAKEYLLGLKDYLQIAEKDRLLFHNAPEKKPEVFEKLLPYAMALGVADIWAKEFEGIYMAPPNWYVGSGNAAFSAMAFNHSLSNFSSYTSSSLSSSSSGSGSGGGGSSGGGGGGGGGGGW
ncbi:MAG: hypothetical protein UV76_C0002G0034 [Candidatus Nomurabacteria bacterium GW2011_GWA2_43_15]|uniref:DUF2207 domain-containing protein n=3 Tax=Candidatus Nomuraibacteriota TaxID=1752729 RepID=A0A0G1DTB9_9BACT|nr:MAG: hypothetical protein UV76_C0002G0034 [Candidatus Nomurabacteria bacterium GW2011_GWA2_43_15]KKT19923.1 MAG: hypothetical protein UW02_C0004G0100 [Candidatus Nomurabacteria bacterium GW2011_GWB1_43_7]